MRNNDFEFDDMYDYFLKEAIVSKVLSYGLNKQLCNCLSYILYKNPGIKESFDVLLSNGKYFFSKNKQINTKLSLISTGLFFILFLMLNFFFQKSQKESFISNIKYKRMYDYYENYIKGMKSKVITLNQSKLLFINNVMYEFLKEYNIAKVITNNTNNYETNNLKSKEDILNTNGSLLNYLDVLNDELEKDISYQIFTKNKLFMQMSKKYNHNNEDKVTLFDEFLKLLQEKDKTEGFINLGQFSHYYKDKKYTYYNVFYRIVQNDNSKFIDFIYDDITDIIIAQAEITSSKEKEKVMAKVAHEFKTPLIIIKNNVNELRNDMTKKQSKEIIDKIINISDYVSFLINDIINESNKNTLKVEKSLFNIYDILDFSFNISKSLATTIGSPNVKLNLLCDSIIKNVNIISDPIRLKQVFLNLLSNAIKFTKSGKIDIKAEVVNIKDDIYDTIIKISDTGVGIRPNDLIALKSVLTNICDIPLVFKQDGKTNSMGTGLGIGICKLILDKLGYSIDVNSEYGKGTEFIITLNNTFIHNSVKNNSFEIRQNNNRGISKRRSSLLINEIEKEIIENTSDDDLSETIKIESNVFLNCYNKEELKLYPTHNPSQDKLEKDMNLNHNLTHRNTHHDSIRSDLEINDDNNLNNNENNAHNHHTIEGIENKNESKI